MAKFEPGKSGNPGGRPKTTIAVRRGRATVHMTLAELAREHAIDAIKALASIAKLGEKDSDRIGASVALLDRGFGRPAQMIGSDPENPLPTPTITAEQVIALLPKVDDEC